MNRKSEQWAKPVIDRFTLVGLVLLITPLMTIGHELLGHGGICWATGGKLVSLGAYYADCESNDELYRRLVSMGGTFMDAVLFAIAYGFWRRSKNDLLRLGLWIAFVGKAMVAGGYFMFSGLGGFGDWSPTGSGGLAPLPYAMLIRLFLAAFGLMLYIAAVRLGNRTLTEMIGGGEDADRVRKLSVATYYWVNGFFAVAVGLLNPVGLFIVLVSSAASSFGGMAGLFSIANARPSEPARAFIVDRNWGILACGVSVAAAFAYFLGPTLHFK